MLKRLIEVALPLKEISEQSSREKSIRHGHISTLHIWWARRPLAACRAVVFASLIPDPDDPDCPESFRSLVREAFSESQYKPKNGDGSTTDDTPRNRCLEYIKYLVRWENSNNRHYLEPARKLIAAAHKLLHPDAQGESPKVLDPFAGGGAIPLEALRLGCEAHAIDLNPVAHLIELCTLVYPQKHGQPNSRPVPDYIKQLPCNHKGHKDHKELFDDPDQPVSSDLGVLCDLGGCKITEAEYLKNPLAADVKYWGHWVLQRASTKVARLYGAPTLGGMPTAFLWTRTAKCPNPTCGCEVPLLQTRAVAIRRNSSTLVTTNLDAQGLTFGLKTNGGNDPEESAGTMSRTSAACPRCGTVALKADLERIGKGKGFGERMICVVESSPDRSIYRSPTPADLTLFDEARLLLNSQDQGLIPTETLPYLRSIFNVHVYGLDKWSKLFNARQGLTMSALLQGSRQALEIITKSEGAEYAAALGAFLAMALGRQADYSTTLCTWTPDGEFVGHTFGRQALPMVWDYAEVNPFADASGNWCGALDWITRVIRRLSELPMPSGDVRRGDATKLPIEDDSLDSVITDPPYYDAVPYADLSDFFYVWQRRLLSVTFPACYSTSLTPKSAELVQLAGRNEVYKNKTKEFFERGMQRSFEESRRVLHSNGLYTVVYAHKTTSAWDALVSSLIRSGLQVVASWPVHTERPGRRRAQASAALASSVFLVCRKRDRSAGCGLWDDIRQELKPVAKERLDFFWSQGIRGADFFISAIGPALSVFGKYERVKKLNGDEVTVGQFLDEVRGLVTSYALSKIMKTTHTATIDPASQFYVIWKWSYGEAKVPADEAFKLAQALGMDTETMWDRTGILEKAGENVLIVPVAKRMKVKNLGEPNADNTPASLIDVLHRLCVFREKNDIEGMTEFLGRSGQGRNANLWLVAQAVSEILPDGDKEKQLMQGLLNQRDQLEEAGREQKLF